MSKSRKKYESNPDNKLKIKESVSKYRQKNKDKIRLYHKNISPETKERKRLKSKEWAVKNREIILEKRRNRYHSRGKYVNKHTEIWRATLNKVVVRMGHKKRNTTIELVGYDYISLKAHIESKFKDGMKWENYGYWEIDHIVPVSVFNKDTPIIIVNALINLQPLWKRENIIKLDKVVKIPVQLLELVKHHINVKAAAHYTELMTL